MRYTIDDPIIASILLPPSFIQSVIQPNTVLLPSQTMASACTKIGPECPVEATTYGYYPNAGANIFLAIFFGLAGTAHLILGIYHRTWTFLIALGIGAFMEMVGYIGRILMHYNPWSTSAFRLQIFCLILAPTFIAAGIYLILKHIVICLGTHHSRLKPSLFTWIFIGCDVASIILQAAGGGVVNSAGSDIAWMNAGNHIIIAGIAFQVATMSACGLLAIDFFAAFWKNCRRQRKSETGSVGETNVERIWTTLSAETVAYFSVLVRCIYRWVRVCLTWCCLCSQILFSLPEMAGGWESSLMRNEREFMVLDGA